jgi:nucleoside-diphosphate-sugar epimerase
MKPVPIFLINKTGFLGRALMEKLAVEKTFRVKGISSSQWRHLNSTNPKILKQWLVPEATVIFSAGLTRDRGPDWDVFHKNIHLITQMGKALTQRPVKKFIYVSSTTYYDQGLDGDSKRFGEHYFQMLCSKMRIRLLIIRPSRVYGPGDPHRLYGPSEFVESLKKSGKIRLFGTGLDRRNYLFIDDFCSMVRKLIKKGKEGIFNLAHPQSHSFRQIVDELKLIHPFPFKLVFEKSKLPHRHQKVDLRRWAKEFPRFSFTPFHEGLEMTYEERKR